MTLYGSLVIVDENDCSSVNIYAQVEGRITTRWSGPGMLRENQTRLYDRDATRAEDETYPGRSARSR
jgi:hypothetical protein